MKGQQYTAAAKLFGQAIAEDKGKFIGYYKRALARIQKGSVQSALKDLDKVLDLKDDYVQARIQRMAALIALGRYQEAQEEYATIEQLKPGTTAAGRKFKVAQRGQRLYETILKHLSKSDMKGAKLALQEALKISSESRFLLTLQIFMASMMHDYQSVADSAMILVKQNGQDALAITWRGIAFFMLDQMEVSEQLLKHANKVHPDLPQAKRWLKKVKKFRKALAAATALKQSSDWAALHRECVDKLLPFLEDAVEVVEGDIRNEQGEVIEEVQKVKAEGTYAHPFLYRVHELNCEALSKSGDHTRAITACTRAIELNSEIIDARIFRAESETALEDFGAAQGDYQAVLNMDKNNRAARQGMQRVQKLKKMADRVDYYKVLGVGRDASKSEIKKAFRKLLLEKHPDKVSGAEEGAKDRAEKEMAKINQAYEVLSDPERRGKYDRGEDLDEQPGGGGHGFDPFSGFAGGFNFGNMGGGGRRYTFTF
mmetsp:Transcript_24355/g.68271  ORF Transcript_24355/g.68271 Transcript_24355/m.68271 type:complete len:484 (+) Transcript_24355:91-1542(+)